MVILGPVYAYFFKPNQKRIFAKRGSLKEVKEYAENLL